MIVGKSRSVALVGLEGTVIEIEAAIGGGLPRTILVGLPDTSLNEARERCKAAVASTGLEWPKQLVTVNLTPATLPKTGSHFDLGITAAVLAAGNQVAVELLEETVLLGELGLDGRVRRCRGVLPALLAAVKAGYVRAVVPAEQVPEALLVDGLTIWGVSTLAELVEVLKGHPVLDRLMPPPAPEPPRDGPDLRDVVGHAEARWVLEVAAAGRHHLFLHGAPGVGKTMLAERLPSILPDLTPSQALEVTAIHSLAGVNVGHGLIRRPPYSAPHHTASLVSLVGGGPKASQPGSLSLSHFGVLFLDESKNKKNTLANRHGVPVLILWSCERFDPEGEPSPQGAKFETSLLCVDGHPPARPDLALTRLPKEPSWPEVSTSRRTSSRRPSMATISTRSGPI